MALAAPAEKAGFFYAGDALYCEASNLNRHRRAMPAELKAHFNGKDTDKNRPAHWYEAQLLHYGLPPSKVKGTAHKRLFDAVMQGGLTVPSHIQKIEAELKKEWTKREREAKKMIKESAAAPKKSAKRKADQVAPPTNVSVNVSFQMSSTGQVTMQAAQPAAKKAKTVPATKAAATPKAPKALKPKASKAVTPKTPKAVTPKAPKAATPKASKAAAPKLPKVATPKAPPKAAPPPTKSAKPTAKGKAMPTQTARRSKAPGSGPSPSFAMGDPSFDDAPPPPYTEVDTNRGSSSQAYQQHSPNQPKLGLLNGRYTVRSDDLDEAFDEAYSTDLGLVATLDNSRLWLKFDFGAVAGIMELDRPYGVSDGRLDTTWRGQAPDEYDGRVYIDQGVDEGNWVEFMGDGSIRGSISWDDDRAYRFEAERLPGQPMRSEISPSEMRRRFENYDRF